MNRIEALSSFINEDDKVIDVGCDQAKLGIMLAYRGIKSIGSDISEKVITKAQETIDKLDLNSYVKLIVSDGLVDVKEDVDTLVLAGMGSHTMLEIIYKTNIKFKKIITISNNYHDMLRRDMLKYNYCVSEELIINENNKYYNLIVFVPGTRDYTEEELLIGVNHKNKELYNEYLTFLLNKYLNIKKDSKDKNSKIDLLIEIIKKNIQ